MPETGWKAALPYRANAVGVWYTCPASDTCALSRVEAGEATVTDFEIVERVGPLTLAIAELPLTAYAAARPYPQDGDEVMVHAISLIDTRLENQFMPLIHPAWERVLSSDIKLYRRTTPRQRAWVARDTRAGILPAEDANVTFTSYAPTRVELEVTASRQETTLILADSFYPGWQATVNESPAPVNKSIVNFRAVALQSGLSHVIFRYDPWWLPGILWAGGAVWAFVGIAILDRWRRPE
jgi:hypothetical protein